MARPGGLSRLLDQVTAAADLPDAPLVVALSGGADSAALAYVAREAGRPVRAVHVHHGLAASDLMAAAAGQVTAALGIPLDVLEVTVSEGASLEAQARAVRYRALEAQLRPGEWLAVGHTRDDQAETVLLNLLRGAGVDGLAGMPQRRPPLVRPLLAVPRSDVRRLAGLAGLPWREDPTNADLRHLRNRVRRRLLPELEGGYAAGVVELLARTAENAAADAALLDRAAAGVRVEERPGGRRVARGELAALPDQAPRVVRRMLTPLLGAVPSRHTVDRVLTVARGGGPVDLPDGLVARAEGPFLVVERPRAAEAPPPTRLRIPGVTSWGGWRFEVVAQRESPVFPLSPQAAVLPEGEAVVRTAASGDRIAVGTGSKAVADALAEARVAPGARASWPVVEVEGAVVWIPGVRRAPFAGSTAERYLCAVAFEEPTWHRSVP